MPATRARSSCVDSPTPNTISPSAISLATTTASAKPSRETAAAAKQKLKAAEIEAKAAQERAAKEKKEADAAAKREAEAKAQRDAKLAKEKAKLAEAKSKAAKAAKAETAKSAKGKSSGKETAKVSSSAFRTTVSEKAAVASEKLESLRSSLPTPEDARELVTAARRKVNAATVAVPTLGMAYSRALAVFAAIGAVTGAQALD